MNKNIIVPVIAIAVILLAGGGYLLTKDSDNGLESSQATTQTSQDNQSAPPDDTVANTQNDTTAQGAEATITYSDNGYSPASLTVKSGTTVTIKNSSSSSIQFDSDPHPAHTANPELNVGSVAPGESKTFTPTTKGSHAYHNHLDSSQTGLLIVN